MKVFNMNNTVTANTIMNVVMNNVKEVGRKKFACIPLDILEVDDRYQRMDSAKDSKVNALTRNFDINMMDAIRVVPHRETGKFYIINGLHRFLAAASLGMESIEAEIIDLPGDVNQRLIEEARLFSQQGREDETLTPAQKHKAYLVLGQEANVTLDRLMKKYNIDMPVKGEKKIGTLTGFTAALRAVKRGSEQMMDDIFAIICGAKWNLIYGGLSNDTVASLYAILKLHADRREDIILTLQKDGKAKTIKEFKADGASKYPTRKSAFEQTTLAIEDYLHDKIGIEYLYLPEAREEKVA